MQKSLLLRVTVLLSLIAVGSQTYPQEKKSAPELPDFLVINRTTMAFYTRQSCLAVLSDGGYKLERVRRRSAKDSPNSVEEYFGKLDKVNFDSLLELSEVRKFPELGPSGQYEYFDTNYHGDRWLMDLYQNHQHLRVRFPNPRASKPPEAFVKWFQNIERSTKSWKKAEKSTVCVAPLAQSPSVSAKEIRCPPTAVR